MVQITPATGEHDLTAMISVASAMHQEGNFSDMEFSPQVFATNVAAFMDSPNHLVLLARTSDHGTPIGGLMALCYRPDFSSQLIAADKGLYIFPSKRGGSTAVRLVKQYIAWAKERGAARICFDVRVGINSERTTHFLTRMGFKVVGHNTIYEGD